MSRTHMSALPKRFFPQRPHPEQFASRRILLEEELEAAIALSTVLDRSPAQA